MYSFRAATRADIGVLVEFVRQLYAHEGIRFDAQVVRAALSRLIQDPSLGRAWVMAYEREIVGYVVLAFGYSIEFGGRDAMLDELFVREDHRGKGLGTEALGFVSEACRELGVRALHLEVERANTAAQGVYRKVGFVDHDRYLMTNWIVSEETR